MPCRGCARYLYAEAAEAFRGARAGDKRLDLARIKLAIALFCKQEYDEARRLVGDALACEPKNPVRWVSSPRTRWG